MKLIMKVYSSRKLKRDLFETEMYTIFAGGTCIILKVSNSVCVIYRKIKESLGKLSMQIDDKNITFFINVKLHTLIAIS